jgi:hypothetical protein
MSYELYFAKNPDFPIGKISKCSFENEFFFILENPAYRQAGKLKARDSKLAAYSKLLKQIHYSNK